MTAGEPDSRLSPLSRLAPPAGLLAAGCVLAAASWRRWPNPLVDFGHELYLAWRISEGDALYRDLVYFMGPFSQEFNGLLFRVFGASFSVLIAANLLILGVISALILSALRRMTDGRTAFVMTLFFLCVFGFSQYGPIGNYNFVTPYLHEATHGFLFMLLTLRELAVRGRNGNRAAAVRAGWWLGLAAMTKAEMFVPAAGASGAAVLLLLARGGETRTGVLRDLPAACLGALAAPVFFLVLLASRMPLADALLAVAGNWPFILNNPVEGEDIFYNLTTGMDRPWTGLKEMIFSFVGMYLFALCAVAADEIRRRSEAGGRVALGVLAVSVALGALFCPPGVFDALFRSLPLVCALGAAAFALGPVLRPAVAAPNRDAWFEAALWSVAALLSLIKIILRARIPGYGFVHAAPGVVLTGAILIHSLPAALAARRSRGGTSLRVASICLFAALAVRYMGISHHFYSQKSFAMSAGGDRIMTDEFHAGVLNGAMEEIRLAAGGREDATLAALPQGSMLNYQMRLRNPTPYYLLTPWEVQAFGGEMKILEAYVRNPPDFFVVFRMDMSTFGKRWFGVDGEYGGRVMEWIHENYDAMLRDGLRPGEDAWWMTVYRRRPEPPGPGNGAR